VKDTLAPACVIHLDSTRCANLQSLCGELRTTPTYRLASNLKIKTVQIKRHGGTFLEADDVWFAKWLEAKGVSQEM
jgi:hypothetical protein